jgi:uncharacterized membrane protein YedE/YeeE
MRTRAAAAIVGTVFGVTLAWSGMSNPEVLRAGLLFRNSYLFLFFASALLTAFVGLRVLRRSGSRAILTGEPLTWSKARPRRRHVAGSVIFGVGWGIADACPGPVATQIGQGVPWGLATAAGLMLGVWWYLHTRETSDASSSSAGASSTQHEPEMRQRAPQLATEGARE